MCLRKHRSNYITLGPSCTSIDNLKASVKIIYSAKLTRISTAVTHWDNTIWEIHDKLKKMKKAHSRTSLSHIHSKTQKLRRQNTNVSSFAKLALPSFPRDRWRNCRLNSSQSIGFECCLEFVIFSQPMVRVTIIQDWVTTFIVVHDRFTTNGYALPVPHVLNRKMDLEWKPQSNLCKTFSHLYYMTYWSKFLQLCIVSAFAYANSRHKKVMQRFWVVKYEIFHESHVFLDIHTSPKARVCTEKIQALAHCIYDAVLRDRTSMIVSK